MGKSYIFKFINHKKSTTNTPSTANLLYSLPSTANQVHTRLSRF